VSAASVWGVGSGSAHLVGGHCSEHHALAEELAHFLRREAVLLFSTGYMANLGVIDALVAQSGVVFQDRLNHASLLDGARLAGARLKRYAHRDMDQLAMQLEKEAHAAPLIVSDGVFSMDGDTAPVPELVRLADQHRALLIIDDAHGIGVLGERGEGILSDDSGVAEQVPVLVGTLGKALGTFGAFVAGSADLVDLLQQRARTAIYTTAIPPAIAAATRASLRIVQDEGWRRKHLSDLVARFRKEMGGMGWTVAGEATPIQPVIVGETEAALQLSQKLEQRGILVTAIRPPTVPKGGARLRVTFSANHTEADLDRLLEAFSEVAVC
jgi:8-amino-7-oxononanoate synthase